MDRLIYTRTFVDTQCTNGCWQDAGDVLMEYPVSWDFLTLFCSSRDSNLLQESSDNVLVSWLPRWDFKFLFLIWHFERKKIEKPSRENHPHFPEWFFGIPLKTISCVMSRSIQREYLINKEMQGCQGGFTRLFDCSCWSRCTTINACNFLF